MSFWRKLPKPFLCVAPMADVTDPAFRRILATHSKTTGGQPFVTWTEFVSADGLCLAPKAGREKLLADLRYDPAERPIVAQLFSADPNHIEQAARLCAELGFDGVDINMGCPVQKIAKQGAGAALILAPERAREIMHAAQAGAGTLPVSVKTRLGYHTEEIETWLPALLKNKPAALSVHCRTRQELSQVPARWEWLTRVCQLRDAISPQTLIIGNGDVLSVADAYERIAATGVDGAMVGRALFGNPWFFHPSKRLPHRLKALPTSGVKREDLVTALSDDEAGNYVTLAERLAVLVEHSRLFVELMPDKSFNIMKKHYKGYCNGFAGAATLRRALMEATSVEAVATIVAHFLATNRS